MNTPEIVFSNLLQDFFLQRLISQRSASAQTIASYRDSFELLLNFAERSIKRPASKMTLADLDAPLVLNFLDYLERERSNSPRTRNARLAAIRSFMRYASLRVPSSLAVAQRVLSIPAKRFDRPLLGFLSREEMEALLNAPDTNTWSGCRDAVLLAVLYNTGARVSEITALRVADVLLERELAIHLHGKGRKERVVPLWKNTAARLRDWINRIDNDPAKPVFCNRVGNRLTRSGVESRLQVAVTRATNHCPSLKNRKISPHTIRHSTAMHLLQSGVDLSVIALWLGHEDPATTHLYVEADLAMKEAALQRLQEPTQHRARYRASNSILAFLQSL